MSLNKLVLPVALGFSLVTITGVVIYYLFKKDEESGDKSVRTSRVNVIEVSVQKSIVPALIGRSGSNIKEIEKKSGALIHFKKFTDKDYDVCIIRGRREATQLAETLVHDFIKQQPLIVEDNMIVPGWSCGRIIGSGGENINDISHRSGARVKIEGSGSKDSTQRTVSLRGTKEQIDVAKKLIEGCVAQEKCRREIEQSKRSPRHSQQSQPHSPASDHSPDDLPGKRTKYKRPEASGASIEVYVSAVSSPSRFWVQLVGGQVAQLDELVDHMTEYYNDKENRTSHTLKQVSVGQVVAAVFRHDGRWYRARVHDIRPNEFDSTQQVADVFFVDYGDSEYVATQELCELRADLLRLRFQAMECFLAGVKPAGREEDVVGVTAGGLRWDRWHPRAVERFEELTQVARWKPLVSRTCSYKKTATGEGEKEKEIPGIKLFDVTEEGELDIGGALIEEGWAVATSASSPRASPPRAAPAPAPGTPFGDLGNSMVLGMLNPSGSRRSSSVPKDHKDDRNEEEDLSANVNHNKENDRMTSSKSLGSGLEHGEPKAVSNFNLTHSEPNAHHVNGSSSSSHDAFINHERHNVDNESTETLVPNSLTKLKDELKANINRIDSHHGNLEALGKHELIIILASLAAVATARPSFIAVPADQIAFIDLSNLHVRVPRQTLSPPPQQDYQQLQLPQQDYQQLQLPQGLYQQNYQPVPIQQYQHQPLGLAPPEPQNSRVVTLQQQQPQDITGAATLGASARLAERPPDFGEYVDFGAHTGDNGAFGWYADYPINNHGDSSYRK